MLKSLVIYFLKRGIPKRGKGPNWTATVIDSRRFAYGVETSELRGMVLARPHVTLNFDPDNGPLHVNIKLVTANWSITQGG